MTEIKTDSDLSGQVQISDEVIAIIAGTAAMEVEGVVSTGSNASREFSEVFRGKKNFAKGVTVVVENSEVTVDIVITINFGTKAHEVALEVQDRVKNAIQTMTSLNVLETNVHVAAVNFEKE